MSIGKGLDCLNPIYLNVEKHFGYKLRVPCGHCLNCKARRTREWSVRLLMESFYHDDIAFCTLTYDSQHLPLTRTGIATLYKRDSQLFFKRLRKDLKYPIRAFTVGEYGTQTQRPHLHTIIFGLKLQDDFKVAKSWQNGFVDVRPFLPGCSEYVAGYVQKKLYGCDKIDIREPEFMTCSRNLGLQYFIDHFNEFDPKLPLIRFKQGTVAVPRTFRRRATDPGWCYQHHFEPWPKLDQFEFALQQESQMFELKEFLRGQSVDVDRFFDVRKFNAYERYTKYESKRIKNTEV